MATTVKNSNGAFRQETALSTGIHTFPISAGRQVTLATGDLTGATYKFVGYLVDESVATRLKHEISTEDETAAKQITSVAGWVEVGVEITAGSLTLEILQSKLS